MNTCISDTVTNFCLYLLSCWAPYHLFETAAGAFWQYGWVDQRSWEVSLPLPFLLLDTCTHFSMCQLTLTKNFCQVSKLYQLHKRSSEHQRRC